MKTAKEMAEAMAHRAALFTFGNIQEDEQVILKTIPLEELLNAASLLKKYQARYHGAEHAQKDWERGKKILDGLSARLADVLSSLPS